MLVMLRAVVDLRSFWCSWGLYMAAESLYSKCMAEHDQGMVGCRKLCKTFRL